MIYVGENKSILYRGDFHPAALYKGDKKIAGYESDGTPTPEAPIEVQSVGEKVTELPKLPTFKGTTVYEIDTGITAKISGEYKKTEEQSCE